MFSDQDTARPVMPVPSPKPSASAMFAGLRELVHDTTAEPEHRLQDGPRAGQLGISDSGELSSISNQFRLNSGIPIARMLFSYPKTFGKVRRSLSSVVAAKSYVYGSTFFGNKKFYNDEFDFKKQPLHPATRRQIRFGLKSVVDFIIQMDIENLKTLLHQRDANVKNFVEHTVNMQDPRFASDSLFGMLNRTNPTSCKYIFEIIERVVSNLHFSQSMAEFLASEGSIEPTKLVVSEALKRGPDLGAFLRGGPFASCAQIYRHLKSRFDFDAAYYLDENNKSKTGETARRTTRNFFGKNRTVGFCFRFQKFGSCNSSDCIFKHECVNCGSKNHGSDKCYRSKVEDRKREERRSKRDNPREARSNRGSKSREANRSPPRS